MTVAVNDLVHEFEKNNEDLTDWTWSVFMNLCSRKEDATRFLNTLSYMEHIGSFKIMATQRAGTLDYPTLKHLNEEAGHAVLFKRHAERLSDEGDGLCSGIVACSCIGACLFQPTRSGHGETVWSTGQLSHSLSITCLL